jgi:hypothetical protein
MRGCGDTWQHRGALRACPECALQLDLWGHLMHSLALVCCLVSTGGSRGHQLWGRISYGSCSLGYCTTVEASMWGWVARGVFRTAVLGSCIRGHFAWLPSASPGVSIRCIYNRRVACAAPCHPFRIVDCGAAMIASHDNCIAGSLPMQGRCSCSMCECRPQVGRLMQFWHIPT